MFKSPINELISCFNPLSTNVNVEERVKNVEIHFKCYFNQLPSLEKILKIFEYFSDRDIVSVILTNILEESVCISKNKSDAKKYSLFCNADEIEPDDEIEIYVKIAKNIENHKISIYNFEELSRWIANKNFFDVISTFNELLTNQQFIIFEVFDGSVAFSTSTMMFVNSGTVFNEFRFDRLEQLKKSQNFSNLSYGLECKLVPEDFHISTNCKNNKLQVLFEKLETILSMIYLSNVAYVEDELLKLQIEGQRIVNFSYNMNSDIHFNEELYRIYSWVMSSGDPADKIGIARNIISLHCKYNDLILTDGKTLASIQSNFSLFQKKSVEQYIDLKNKMAEFIIQIVNQTSDAIDGLLGRLKNNIFAFISFILTVFLINIVSKAPLNNIFTEDITRVCYFVVCGSIAFLIISVMEVNARLEKIKTAYQNLKMNYNDILDEKDIDNIFNNDKLFKDAVRYVESRRDNICVLWVTLLIIFVLMIENASSAPLFLI